VRDGAGDVRWIPGRGVGGPSRHGIVSRALGAVRGSPSDVGPLLFQAERGVLLEVVDEPAPSGWLAVRYRDGTTGFVSTAEVWGH
jgi:hypothetical protein